MSSIARSGFVFWALFVSPVFAATIVVGPPPASIQAAINTAASGDTIQLSAGTYVQEFQVISKSLTIVGAGQNATIVQAPGPSTRLTQSFTFGVTTWAVVMVDNQAAPTPQTVDISNLTVDGGTQQDTTVPPIYGSSNRFFAIGYHNAGGTIQSVHTTNTRQTANFNELAGGGIINASDTGIVTFNVTNSLIDFYQRIGIDCRGPALTANVSASTINRGYVLTPNSTTATPNGIQYSGSVAGSISNNLVDGNISTVLGASATGILPFGASTVTVTTNTVNNNDIGIVAIQSGNNLTISNNTLNFTTVHGVNPVEGIVVQDTNGLSVLSSNVMNALPDINMELIASTNQAFQLMQNRFNGSQTGLIVTGSGSAGPVVTMSADSFSGTSGYYIQEVAAPNNTWPSTATVTFDGLVSGHISFAEFNQILTKIFDKHNDPALGLVLDFIPPAAPTIAGITPPSGSAAGGTPVTITGSGFLSSNTNVFFGAAPATNIVVVSDSTITLTSPPGAGTVDVEVVTPFGTATLALAYAYLGAASTQIPVDSRWMWFMLTLAIGASVFFRRRL